MACNYNFFVYIMASKSGTLYIGFTNDLVRRTFEHKQKHVEGFTKQYGCNRLIYFEHFTHVDSAIQREKQLKRWSRRKKEVLIKKLNPTWRDLSDDWK